METKTMTTEELKKLIWDEITTRQIHLGTLEPGSEEASREVENINKLSRIIVEIEAKEAEALARNKADRNAKLDILVKALIGAGTIGVSLLGLKMDDKWTGVGFEFEETGNISSITQKNLYNKRFKRH